MLRHYFANKGLSGQGYCFSSIHAWMWGLDCEESWAPKNWCFWTTVLEKTLESSSDCKETQPVPPDGEKLGVHWKDWCWSWNSNTFATSYKELTHWKRPWCWEGLGQEEKGTTEDEMAGWHQTQWAWVWVNSGSLWWTGRLGVLQFHGVAKSQTRLSGWTELSWTLVTSA